MKKGFISFYYEDDNYYKEELQRFNRVNNIFIDESVDKYEIDDENMTDQEIRQVVRDEFLRQTEVTILLLGRNTHHRKHVDWEISSSLRDTDFNPRSSLIVVVLPSHPAYIEASHSAFAISQRDSTLRSRINQTNTSERISKNVKNGYATILTWNDLDGNGLSRAIDDSLSRMRKINPDNSAIMRRRNSEPSY